MQAKQIRAGVWEFQSGLPVPVRIYANERIFQGIEEGVLKQASNVAKLPGIQKASLVMPDAHYGYGFPIGGVAAFDLEEGVVSPGGVGYDINCLPTGTNVLMSDYSLESIENIKLKEKVLVYEKEKDRLRKSSITLTLKKKDEIFEVITSSGERIRSTLDHPFLTPAGMASLERISLGERIGLYREGFGWDTVKSIKLRERDTEVYDFTVANDHHNFIANNFVVSNCGVRLLSTNLIEQDIRPKLRDLVDNLFRNVPSGVGSKSKIRLSESELDEVLSTGAQYAVKKGYGTDKDLKHMEENGCMEGANPSKVSHKAKKRGKPQLGTMGSGNHFLEVQKVDKIFQPEIAARFGIREEGQITVMVHCGSRGLGHQVADDYIHVMMNAARKYGISLPDRELACAPLKSGEAQSYMSAMKCAVNYAFCNRQVITHWVRETFARIFPEPELSLVYDVCHNIAKFEEHGGNRLCVHRKGATRAFAAGRDEIPSDYREIGQPVIIPGDMGTASYILIGTEKAMEETFGSACHGAGRVMSRKAAIKRFRGEDVKRRLEQKGEVVRATSWKSLAEEVPEAYKDVDEVIKSVELSGISKAVARVVPLGVAKG